MRPHYLLEERKPFILAFLDNISKNTEVTLWQNTPHGRKKFSACLVEVGQQLKLFPLYNKAFFFDPHYPLYFWEKKRMILFRTRIEFNSTFHLRIQFPRKVHVKELRNSPRQGLSHQKHLVCFSFLQEIHDPRRKQNREVFDQSQKGLSFRVHKSEFPLFYQDDLLVFHEDKEKWAKICHITPLHDLSHHYRVGVQYL